MSPNIRRDVYAGMERTKQMATSQSEVKKVLPNKCKTIPPNAVQCNGSGYQGTICAYEWSTPMKNQLSQDKSRSDKHT